MGFKKIILTITILFVLVSQSTFPSSVQAQVTVQNIIDQYPQVNNAASSGKYIDKIRRNIGLLMTDGTHRNYPGTMTTDDYNKVMWWKGFEVAALASTIPYLPTAQQTQLKAFLKYEVENYLLNDQFRQFETNSDLRNRQTWLDYNLSWWQWRGVQYEHVYGVWAYAHYTGDWTLVQNNWNTIVSMANQGSTPGKKFMGFNQNYLTPNSEPLGRIALARMAKKLFQMTNQSTYQSTYNTQVSTLNSQIPALSSHQNRSMTGSQVCDFEGVTLCNQDRVLVPYFAQYDFLTPELGRWFAANYSSQAQTNLNTAETQFPFWYMGGYNLMHSGGFWGPGAGGEGYFQHPNLAYQMFQAKARILNAPLTELEKKLPWPNEYQGVPHYWDVLQYVNLITLAERTEGVTWVDTNTAPQTITYTPGVTPTPLPTVSASATPSTSCREDINNDRFVDISDYSLLVADFFKSGSLVTDINQDNFVDITDYSMMVAKFLQSC